MINDNYQRPPEPKVAGSNLAWRAENPSKETEGASAKQRENERADAGSTTNRRQSTDAKNAHAEPSRNQIGLAVGAAVCAAKDSLLSALETWLANPTGPGESLTRAALEAYFADPVTLTGGAQ